MNECNEKSKINVMKKWTNVTKKVKWMWHKKVNESDEKSKMNVTKKWMKVMKKWMNAMQ